MNVKIEVKNPQNRVVCLMVNNRRLKGKSHKETLFYDYETSEKEITLLIYETSRFNNPKWLLWELFYFIISLFSLFDFGKPKSHYEREFRARVFLESEHIIIRYNDRRDGDEALTLETTNQVEIFENKRFMSPIVEKRRKTCGTMKKIALILAIASVICLAIYITIQGGL